MSEALTNAIYAGLADVEEKPRGHLGASVIGHYCDRWIWLSFRWAITSEFDGRMRRLFRRGHLEEDQVVKDLRKAGMTVFDADPSSGRQFNIKDGHFGGSMDGIIKSGVPGNELNQHLLEIKTHSTKSFDDVVKNGVAKAKPQHYAQMQVYMFATGIKQAVYLAVCKNDDRLYTEIVSFNYDSGQKLIEKAQRLIAADRMPEPISSDPTWYQCKFCDAHAFCHESRLAKNVNCRTCAHSTAVRDGTWHCSRWNSTIPSEDHQIKGCDDHVLHPDLVPWAMEPSEDGLNVTWIIEGEKVTNGPNGKKSREIVANPLAVAGKYDMVNQIMALFPGAEVIG
jgi:hypothetical protein